MKIIVCCKLEDWIEDEEIYFCLSLFFHSMSISLLLSLSLFADTQHPRVVSQLLQQETCSSSAHNTLPTASPRCPWAICLVCILQICQCYLIIIHTKVFIMTLTAFAKSFVLLHMLDTQKAPVCAVCSYGTYASTYVSICGLSTVSKYSEALLNHIQRKLWPLHVLHHAVEHVNSAPRNDFQLTSHFAQDSVSLFFRCFCGNHIVEME